MAKLVDAFDAVGIVRSFKEDLKHHSRRTTFELEVGKIVIPCHANVQLETPPRNGESARVVGDWVVDDDKLICVAVREVYPARYDSPDAHSRVAGRSA